VSRVIDVSRQPNTTLNLTLVLIDKVVEKCRGFSTCLDNLIYYKLNLTLVLIDKVVE
jgi:hypothetical protein